jgi:SAM-dependent methyltransferase
LNETPGHAELGVGKTMNPATEVYRGERGRRYHAEKRAVPAGAEAWVARARARVFSPHIQPHHTVFEFGVGLGWNLAALTCQRRLGFDIADSTAEVVRSRGVEWVSDLAELGSGLVDVVICHHTLEHVPDPLGTITTLRTLLRADGRLLLTVPWERENRYRRFDPAEPNHHLYTWNCQTLGNLATVGGFAVQKVGTARYGYDRFAATLAWRLGTGETGFRVGRALLRIIRPLWEVRLVASP